MLKFVVATCLASAAAGQFVDPQNAKILKEQRFNAGDGRFGSAYAQEDGSVFREETTADGERVGQYSYIGDDGQTITVRYTAGKDGFRILEGAHVPNGANGLNSAAFDPAQAGVQAAAPTQAPARFVPAAPATPAPVSAPLDYDYVDAPVDPNFNPFINPHDPTHRDFQFNTNGAKFAPQSSGAVSNQFLASVPNCANCAGVNPFVNPFDASHTNAGLLAGHQAGFQARQPVQQAVQPAFRPQQPRQPALSTFITTTPAPKRFFPPGQLKLNRFETGFNFDFASQ